MNKSFFVGMTAIFLLTGCAITQKPSAQDGSQMTTIALERKLEQKNQEIQILQSQVDELNQQLNRQRGAVKSMTSKTMSGAIPNLTEQSKNELKDLIRVDASAQDVQLALKNAGYYDGNVDGKIGPRSHKAIMDFQMDHNLKGDGIVGKQTWLELKSYLDQPMTPAPMAVENSTRSQE